MCEIYLVFNKCVVSSSCLKLSCGRCSSRSAVFPGQKETPNHISPWSLKKNNEQRVQSLSAGELNIILAIRSVAFSGEKYNLLLPLLASQGKYMELSKGGILAFSDKWKDKP